MRRAYGLARSARHAARSGAIGCALLAACAGPAGPPQQQQQQQPPAPPSTSTSPQGAPKSASVGARATIVQPASRWVPAAWSDLPGWNDDRVAQALPALARQCESKPLPSAWTALCAELARANRNDDAALRQWLMQRFDPYRVESADGRSDGMLTGYFEPLLEASRVPRGAQRHALHRTPIGMQPGQAWYTRKESETLPAAQAALRGREIAYVADPLDVLVLQIQGSGRAVITEADGRRSLVRLAFAAHNDRPYQSVGRWLIDQGQLARDGASWPAIRDWARRNPARVNEMLWVNPRLVFFTEEPLPDAATGPRGAQGLPLTAERSIAVDPRSIPYGTPVWIDASDASGPSAALSRPEPPAAPSGGSGRSERGGPSAALGRPEPPTAPSGGSERSERGGPLRRLVMAQDTGSAITGAVRADYFWGAGDRAEREAGRMKQPLRMWVLAPKAAATAP